MESKEQNSHIKEIRLLEEKEEEEEPLLTNENASIREKETIIG